MEKDKVLYRKFLKGDEKSFDVLMNRYMEKLIYFINGFVKNLDVSEDLAQDVFVYILLNKKHYDFKYSLKTYLFMIGKSRALNYLKKNSKIIELDNKDFLIDEDEIEEIIFKKEKNKRVRDVIKQLPLEQRQAVYLADIEEISYKEICDILDISMSKAKTLIHRGRQKLKKMLNEKGIRCYE